MAHLPADPYPRASPPALLQVGAGERWPGAFSTSLPLRVPTPGAGRGLLRVAGRGSELRTSPSGEAGGQAFLRAGGGPSREGARRGRSWRREQGGAAGAGRGARRRSRRALGGAEAGAGSRGREPGRAPGRRGGRPPSSARVAAETRRPRRGDAARGSGSGGYAGCAHLPAGQRVSSRGRVCSLAPAAVRGELRPGAAPLLGPRGPGASRLSVPSDGRAPGRGPRRTCPAGGRPPGVAVQRPGRKGRTEAAPGEAAGSHARVGGAQRPGENWRGRKHPGAGDRDAPRGAPGAKGSRALPPAGQVRARRRGGASPLWRELKGVRCGAPAGSRLGLTGSVTLGRSLHLSKPQFARLSNRGAFSHLVGSVEISEIPARCFF